ncbi:MAG: preprotein translocase subunit SecG [Dehalococcoidia bacterium]|nr:preprotein translocase subunit SecG [Dehalococcoidia bacterium]
MELKDYLAIVQIIISLTLILIVLVQARGEGWSPRGGSSITRTRRGVEKTLFQLTIIIVALFLLISALSVRAGL